MTAVTVVTGNGDAEQFTRIVMRVATQELVFSRNASGRLANIAVEQRKDTLPRTRG